MLHTFTRGLLLASRRMYAFDVLGVVQHVRRAHNVMKKGVRRRHTGAQRQMVHQLVDKNGSVVNSLIFLAYSV